MKSKLLFLCILFLGLASCEITPTPTEEGEPTATATFTPKPAQADVVPEVEDLEPTETFTPEPAVSDNEEILECTELLTPEDGAELGASGAVTFSWEPVDGAVLYQLYILFPSEVDLTFELAETSITRYTEAFSMHPAYHQGGVHQWNVTALNAKGEIICSSDFFTFTKPDSTSASGDAPQGDGGDGESPLTLAALHHQDKLVQKTPIKQ